MENTDLAQLMTVLKIILAPLISSHEGRSQLVNRLDQVVEQSNGPNTNVARTFAVRLLEQVRQEDAAAGR